MGYKNGAKYTLSDYADMCLKTAIFERKSRQSLAQIATESGFTTLIEDGFKQVLLGKTTLSELTRVLDLGFLGDEIMEVILGEF